MKRRIKKRRFGPKTLAEHARSKEVKKRYEVSLHRLDRQGYDSRGRYYGIGQKLFNVTDDNDGTYFEVRASTANDARMKVLTEPGKWRR